MVKTMNGKPVAVSVVVPCRNEMDCIESCLRSILRQESPEGGFEVLVADGMSDDGTRDILARLATEDERLHVIENPRGITPAGMNAGIRAARGRYIAIMGAHNTYSQDYLLQCVQILEQKNVDNVGGALICDGKSWLQRAIAGAHHSPFSAGGARWHNANYEGPADTVFGGVYRRDVFDRIGLLDEELIRNQDDEFNLRLVRAGGKIWHSGKIKSWYAPRKSVRALFRQYVQYGYWKVRVIQKHQLPASVRHLVPGCFLLSIVALGLLALLWPPAALFWLGLLATYFLCNLGASVLVAATNGWSIFPLLPIIFATYHFGYGYGFLRGICDFVILRRRPAPNYTKLTRTAASRQ